jgi:hypothetical protein
MVPKLGRCCLGEPSPMWPILGAEEEVIVVMVLNLVLELAHLMTIGVQER